MSDDLIKRSDAIRAVSKVDDYGDGIGFEVRSHCLVELELVPSADRPQGEWYQIKDHKVMGEGYMWHCSLCDHRVYQDSSADYPAENYCPNCGARMKGADDETD